MSNNDLKKTIEKKDYKFGEVKEYDLEKIEAEVLHESVYLDVFAGSDVRFKENVQELNSRDILNKVINLNAYQFDYKTNEFKNESFPEGKQIGFMAQEVNEQFPELIKRNNDGMMYVNYMQMVPLMAETIKELNSRIEVLEKKLKDK
jgi:hypothetical protein